MSNFQAVASVTAALRQRLLETVQVDVPMATVTALRPADPGTAGIPQVGVNLFLFGVHINAAQRNRDLPLRRGDGASLQVPVVPLDLDYLVSFYGDQNGMAHQLVGSVMRSLYARPILTAAMIQAVEGAGLQSGLADQADRVQFTPLPLPIEEMSKLWSVFFQTSYALSVAFRAGPVLVEADVPLTTAPPVTAPQVTALPTQQPQVSAVVLSGADASAAIVPGSTIDILGTALSSAATMIVVGGGSVVPLTQTTTKLTAALPATLAAGPQGLQVRQDVSVGQPASTRPGVLSNLASFVLHPVVTPAVGGGFAITLTGETGAGAQPRAATVVVGLTPPVGATQTAALELLDLSGVTQHVFRETPRTAAAGTVSFAVTGVAAGTYALRVRVDGAATPVGPDTAPGSATLGQLIPQVVFA